jgi:transcription-repair coupling factor (superfamily II helicase)
MELKIAARKAYVSEIKKQGHEIRLFFKETANIEPDKIISLVTKKQKHVRLLPEGGIAVRSKGLPEHKVFALLVELLTGLR